MNNLNWKIEKVVAVNQGNWKNYNNLRNDNGVLHELESVASTIGRLKKSYHATTRAHAGSVVDKETFERLVAENKIIPREKDE